MAWCPHCKLDRPIQRQLIALKCEHCGRSKDMGHKVGCRGPVIGALDVCTHCNTPVFAKALDEVSYNRLQEIESKIDKNACFVITATMGDENHPAVVELRSFRDNILLHYRLGNRLIAVYCIVGPAIARLIKKSNALRFVSYYGIVAPSLIITRLIKGFLRE